MDGNWMEVVVIVLAVVGSNVWLHRDIAALRERMAKLEGTVELLAGVMLKGQQPHTEQ